MNSDPSLVLNEQTTAQPDPNFSYGELLRLSCKAEFAAAYLIYKLLDRDVKYSKAERLRGCRENAWFTRNTESGEVRVAASTCSLRWCPVCRNARRNYVTHEIAEWLCNADHPKLITLTLLHSETPLDEQIQRLYDSFRELRRRKDFKSTITGGIWFFQVKRSKKDGLWHPHLHCLVTGKFLPRKRLSNLWLQVTTDSEVIDIRSIYEPKAVANDVARYATSPGSLVNLPPDDGIELVEALEGRRICGTWGTARGVSLRPKRQSEPGKWQSLGRWSTVMGMYESSANARAIVLSWKTGISLSKDITLNDIDMHLDKMLGLAWDGLSMESNSDHERSPPECLLF